MFKMMKEKAPTYLINLVPKCEPTIRTWNNSIPTFNCRTDCFKYSFSPSTLNDWFDLDPNINAKSFSLFKSRLLSFIRPVQRSIYNIFDPTGLKFLSRHNFQDCLNPLCSCSLEIEDTSHYLLHCHHFSHHCVDLMNSVKSVCGNFESMPENVKKDLLLFRYSRFDENKSYSGSNNKLYKKCWKILCFPI